MALTIHGSARSRTMRVLWMATELGLEFEHDPIAFDDPGLKSPEFQRLNPAGAIPTLEDGDFALPESLAINLCLAKRYGLGRLYPTSLEGEAQVWRWSLWAQGQLEPWLMRDALLADLRAAVATLSAPVVVGALGDAGAGAGGPRTWLIGGSFTVADLNVAAVLSPSRAEHLDLAPYPSGRRLAGALLRPARRAGDPPAVRIVAHPDVLG